MIRLIPMTQERFKVFSTAVVTRMAEQSVKARSWVSQGASEKAEGMLRRLLPQGLASPGHHLFELFHVDSEAVVGTLWVVVAVPNADGEVESFALDIEVWPEHRGQGIAAAAMHALHCYLLEHHVTRVRLDIFEHNVASVRLALADGFTRSAATWTKELRA